MATALMDNPFRLPPDDQIFLVRKEERESRATERERIKQLKVHEKTTASSRKNRNRRTYEGTDEQKLREEADKTIGRSQSLGPGSSARHEKENVADFVAKKREMFLLQMGLDVKRSEMQKLKEKGDQKEEALRKSEQMLDEDVTRFDLFLQNNDQKAHNSMKVAEDMTKEKQEKVARIKILKQSLSAVQSEITKNREAMVECSKYKWFLTRLTPPEWKDAQEAEAVERRLQRRRYWVEDRFAEGNRQMQVEIDHEERLVEERAQEAGKGKRRQKREVEEEARERERQLQNARRRIRQRYPTRESVEEQYEEVDSGEEMPMYFAEPSQLLDVFTSLEESNLFLIQNSQDTEQVLEQLQQQFASMKRQLDTKNNRLKQNIEKEQGGIQNELLQCENLRQIISQKRAGTKQDELLNQLKKEVYDVHAASGQDSANDLDTLEMLKGVEAKLEEFLTYLDEAEAIGYAAQVEEMERKKKRDRRDMMRKNNKDQNDRRNEERLQASLKRSQAPVHKKVGKQIMFRSAPLFQQRKAVEEDDGFEESKRDHTVFGIFLAKTGEPVSSAPTKAA